jgi:hypothetical protein
MSHEYDDGTDAAERANARASMASASMNYYTQRNIHDARMNASSAYAQLGIQGPSPAELAWDKARKGLLQAAVSLGNSRGGTNGEFGRALNVLQAAALEYAEARNVALAASERL